MRGGAGVEEVDGWADPPAVDLVSERLERSHWINSYVNGHRGRPLFGRAYAVLNASVSITERAIGPSGQSAPAGPRRAVRSPARVGYGGAPLWPGPCRRGRRPVVVLSPPHVACAPESFDLITAPAPCSTWTQRRPGTCARLTAASWALAIVGLLGVGSPVDFAFTIPAIVGDRRRRLATPRRDPN
jgi:hypothetical protein